MRMEPRIPAHTEPMRTAILPASLRCWVTAGSMPAPPKLSVSTKMDIVKPIPPRQATAKSIGHEALAGISPTLSLIARADAAVIPRGFPLWQSQRALSIRKKPR